MTREGRRLGESHPVHHRRAHREERALLRRARRARSTRSRGGRAESASSVQPSIPRALEACDDELAGRTLSPRSPAKSARTSIVRSRSTRWSPGHPRRSDRARSRRLRRGVARGRTSRRRRADSPPAPARSPRVRREEQCPSRSQLFTEAREGALAIYPRRPHTLPPFALRPRPKARCRRGASSALLRSAAAPLRARRATRALRLGVSRNEPSVSPWRRRGAALCAIDRALRVVRFERLRGSVAGANAPHDRRRPARSKCSASADASRSPRSSSPATRRRFGERRSARSISVSVP